jgi:hypothetical protein
MCIITLIFLFLRFFFLYFVAFFLLLHRFASRCGIFILPKQTSSDSRHYPVPTCYTEEVGHLEKPGVGFEPATPMLKLAATTADIALCINTAQVSQIAQFESFMAQ